MLKHYLTITLRGLFKYKLQNIFCILGLAVGLSAFVFGTYWWYWENHFDDFHPDEERILAITTSGISQLSDGSDLELNQVHKDDVAAFLQELPEIETASCVNEWGQIEYKKGDTQEKLMGIAVDSTFFSLFYTEFIEGGYRNATFDNSHIVLTEKSALKIFGKTDCTGELFLTANGSKTIAGVIKDYPSNSDFRLEFLGLSNSTNNNMGRSSFYIKLHPTADINAVRKKIEAHKSVAQLPEWQKESVKNRSFHLRSLQEKHFTCRPELKSRFLNVRLLFFAGLLALACAMMNVLTLFIGQQQRKRAKNKTFKSMGASNGYLFGKSFIDLCLPVLLAVLLAILLISALFPLYQNYTQLEGYGIYENYYNRIELKDLVAYSLGYPAIALIILPVLGSLLIAGMLRRNKMRSFSRIRNLLIISQIFIGCFFFFISLSLYKQVTFTQNKDKGIVVKNITQIDVGYNPETNFKTLGEELLRSPYIEDLTFTTIPILSGLGDWYMSYISGFSFKDAPDKRYEINVFIVEPNFIDFFGIKLKEGKWVTGKDELVINETQKQSFGEKNPVQNPVQKGKKEVVICGVIQDYYYSTMQYPVKGLVFHLQQEDNLMEPYQYVYIKTKPENHDKAVEYAQSVLETVKTGDVAPGRQILELQDIQDEFNRPEKTLFRIFGFLSFICILIVSFGIYSLVTLTIEQRRKEIAIRKINGAEIRDILTLFLRNYLLLVIIGNALSLPVASYFISRWLENYVYRTALSWWLFAVVFIATCLIVLLSIFEKVRMAAGENPAEVVKSE